MGKASLGSILIFVSILAVQMKSIEYTDQLEKTDKELFGKCNGITVDLTPSETDGLHQCKTFNDYRCFKACQSEHLGIMLQDGNINPETFKFRFHVKNDQFGFKDGAYIKTMANCSDKGFVLTEEKSKCDQNEKYLKCLIEQHYKHCMPNERIPPVPTNVS